MPRELIIQDVCDVILRDKLTGKVMANTKLQMSALEGTISEEDLRAGIGNGKIFKIRSEKDLNLNFRSATFSSEWLAMTQGVDVEERTVSITKIEHLTVDDTGQVDIKGTPKDGVASISFNGKFETDVDVVSGLADAITSLGASKDDEVEVSYKVEVTGEGLVFDSQKFSRKTEIEMRTIAYDLDTAEVVSDIYFIFPECLAGGDISMSFEAGQVITPEISFSVLQPANSTEMGEMVEVLRTTTP
ncbi:hypothetical protein ABE073_03930 [Lederbergia citrisecunda]|uniref:hypothetical protein n=1 Tax=Lederbergia citrisecunda TaxID=2833583 RepID=UPI003D2A9AD5